MFHRLESRICVHVLLCWLALSSSGSPNDAAHKRTNNVSQVKTHFNAPVSPRTAELGMRAEVQRPVRTTTKASDRTTISAAACYRPGEVGSGVLGGVLEEPTRQRNGLLGTYASDDLPPEDDIDALVRDAFLYPPITEQQRVTLHRALDIGLSFMDGSMRDRQPLRYRESERLRKQTSSPIPPSGIDANGLLGVVEDVARWSIAQCDPAYLAFPDTGNSFAGLIGDILAACLNQNMIAVDRSAPVGSHIEAQLILWLRQVVGYSSHVLDDLPNLASLGGMWTSGGNMSNHVAVVTALNHRFPEVADRGLVGLRKRPVIVLAHGVEHFSYRAAAQVLGLGRDAFLWTSPSADFSSDPEALAEALVSAPDDVDPFMVVAVAGNCRTTTIDDLNRFADLCTERGVWLHVDACHGGSLLFSRSQRYKLHGIERSDSISLDPHKGLFTTYACSYALFKEPSTLTTFARYPSRIEDPDCWDLGLITPFYGSRRFESLKLWLLIKHLGLRGLERTIDARQQTFLDLVGLLDANGYFTVLNEASFYRVAFVFLPSHVRERLKADMTTEDQRAQARAMVDAFTVRFSEHLYQGGRVIFDQFALNDLADVIGLGRGHKYQVMGLAVGHPLVPLSLHSQVSQAVIDVGSDLAQEMEESVEAIAGSCAVPVRTARLSGPAGW